MKRTLSALAVATLLPLGSARAQDAQINII